MTARVRLLGLVAVFAVLAACASTVPEGTTTASGDAFGLDGGTVTTPTERAPDGATSTTALGAAPAAGPATDGTPSSGRPAARAGASTPGGAGRANVPGMTGDEIVIGVYTALAFNQVARQLGFSAVNTGDQAAEAQAVADHLNENGGIAGRQIRLVFHDKNAADSGPVAAQAACTAWTEDDRVFAVVTPVSIAEETLYDCLQQRGVMVSAAGEAFDRKFFEDHAASYYQPGDINQTRAFRTVVDALVPAKFFGDDAKIGVLARDIPADHRAVDEGLVPALERHGLSLEEEFYTSMSAAEASNDYSSAVLRFRASGVTHIVFANLVSPLTFGLAAESQEYRPRYALNSRNSPAAILQGNVPERQLRGAMGAGWIPYQDVDGARDPGPATPRAALCQQLMEDAGQDTSIRATALIGAWYCDTFFFVDDVVERAADFSPAGIRQAAEALGDSYEPASTFATSFAPDRTHDGAVVYRLLAYDHETCHCFHYVSEPRRTA